MNQAQVLSKDKASELFETGNRVETVEQAPEQIEDSKVISNKQYNSNKGAAIELLGKGIPESQVASILQVSPSLISQYKQDPAFNTAVTEVMIESQLAASLRDDKLDQLEDKALDKMSEVMDLIYKPADVLATLRAINGMTRRANPALLNGRQEQSSTVRLTLPANCTKAAIEVQLNSSKEIIQVNGEELRTMPAAQVAKKAELLTHDQETG